LSNKEKISFNFDPKILLFDDIVFSSSIATIVSLNAFPLSSASRLEKSFE
jgi:hypothetical protein